jgi:NTE family protein
MSRARQVDLRTFAGRQATAVQLTLHDSSGARRIAWSDVGGLDWSNFGLVLGAGGATGLSFEAGCLLALTTDHRVRLADADVLVGTSAGSIAATLIALGFDGLDLAAVVAEVDHHLDPALASMGVRFEGELPTIPGVVQLLRRPTIGSTATGMGLVLRRRFTAALTNALRTGEFDLAGNLPFLDGIQWPAPEGRLRVCAVASTTGRRRVFAASSGVALVDAVSASCAVPAVMRPVMIDGVPYVDGGLVSPTNADVLEDFEGALTAVVSPMSGRHSTSTIGRMGSAHARRRLGTELRRLGRRHQILVIEPANRLSEMVVDSALSTAHKNKILMAAFLGSSQPD